MLSAYKAQFGPILRPKSQLPFNLDCPDRSLYVSKLITCELWKGHFQRCRNDILAPIGYVTRWARGQFLVTISGTCLWGFDRWSFLFFWYYLYFGSCVPVSHGGGFFENSHKKRVAYCFLKWGVSVFQIKTWHVWWFQNLATAFVHSA